MPSFGMRGWAGRALCRVSARLAPPTRFAIVSRGRTGSTLLLSLLDSHPLISQRGEVIGESQLGKEGTRRELQALGPIDYVERCFEKRAREAAVGIKILYYQTSEAYAQRLGVEGLSKVLDYLVSQREVRILHVKRKNRLRTLVSLQVAARTQQYRLLGDEPRVAEAPLELTPDQCVREFERVDAWEREYDEIFRDHDLLEVLYEDLAASRESESDRVLDFLGLPRRALATAMRKQSRLALPDLIVNYEPLKAHFAATPWARFFED
jgi:LPS sulfotransferase NodH